MQKAFLDLSLYAFMPKSLCNSRQISYQRISDKALAGCWIVMLPIRGIGIVRYCILLNSYDCKIGEYGLDNSIVPHK